MASETKGRGTIKSSSSVAKLIWFNIMSNFKIVQQTYFPRTSSTEFTTCYSILQPFQIQYQPFLDDNTNNFGS